LGNANIDGHDRRRKQYINWIPREVDAKHEEYFMTCKIGGKKKKKTKEPSLGTA
jgi:hypothetical protein